MCKYSCGTSPLERSLLFDSGSGRRDTSNRLSTTTRTTTDNQESFVVVHRGDGIGGGVGVEQPPGPRSAYSISDGGKLTENRETPEHIRSTRFRRGDRNKKMFQQKLVIVIRTFLLFFLFQPSTTASLVAATTIDAEPHNAISETDWQKLWQNAENSAIHKQDPNGSEVTDPPGLEETEVMAHNTTVQLGGTAFLVCKVTGVDRVGVHSNQISWIRRRDWHILSSGAQMYTNDERFVILHTPGSNTWTLQIKFVQRRDHGMYECQVSTATGVISHFVNLQVVVPEAFILGSGELHVDMGSTINLVCIIEKSPQPPQYVFWQKNERMINYDDSRRDITIETSPGPRTQSRLIIREPQIADSGNYTCSASNTEPASIYVFVSKGDNTAAISRRKTSAANRIDVIVMTNLLTLCSVLFALTVT